VLNLGRNTKFNLKFSLRKRSAFEPKVVSGIHYPDAAHHFPLPQNLKHFAIRLIAN